MWIRPGLFGGTAVVSPILGTRTHFFVYAFIFPLSHAALWSLAVSHRRPWPCLTIVLSSLTVVLAAVSHGSNPLFLLTAFFSSFFSIPNSRFSFSLFSLLHFLPLLLTLVLMLKLNEKKVVHCFELWCNCSFQQVYETFQP